MPNPLHGIAQFSPQMRQRQAAQVAQLNPDELWPDAFIRIQVWGIGWQALQVQQLRCTVGEQLLDKMAAVDRRAIPDDPQAARDFTSQVLQKGNYIL